MASEILSVPEAHLHEVIGVIRRGLKGAPRGLVSRKARIALTQWCVEEEAYLRRLAGEEETAEEKSAADERWRKEQARLGAICTCNHALVQHKGRQIGGKCWACKRCKGFEQKPAGGAARTQGRRGRRTRQGR